MGNTALNNLVRPEQELSHTNSRKRVSLAAHYQMVGRALLSWERANSGRTNSKGGESEAVMSENFREDVVFVPVEVLESYLEDLLEPQVSESSLYIARSHFRSGPKLCAGLGLGVAMLLGLFAASTGASLVYSMAVTFICAVPFATLWHFAPQSVLTRRMTFAQVVSHEIFRRRGIDGTRGMRPIFSGDLMEFFGQKRPASIGGGYFAIN